MKKNGSYILPNGVTMLVEEDVTNYLQGKLEFIDEFAQYIKLEE